MVRERGRLVRRHPRDVLGPRRDHRPTGGTISLWQIDLQESRSAWVGYRTAPWARGCGVATAALLAVTGWAFGGLGVERISLPHTVGNDASCRVAAKAGYVLEGVMRGAWREPDGTRLDDHLHARLTIDPYPA